MYSFMLLLELYRTEIVINCVYLVVRRLTGFGQLGQYVYSTCTNRLTVPKLYGMSDGKWHCGWSIRLA
jgi:hypothetical protein